LFIHKKAFARGKFMKIFVRCAFFSFFFFASILSFNSVDSMHTDKATDTNIIGQVAGDVIIIRFEKEIPAQPKVHIFIKDSILTDKKSNANLQLTDDSNWILEENTILLFNNYSLDDKKEEGETSLALTSGLLKVMLGKNDVFIYTPLSTADSADKDKVLNIVNYKNSDPSIEETVKVFPGYMSCVVRGERPTVPVPVPEIVIEKYGPFTALDFIVWETETDGKLTFCIAVFEFEECEECEILSLRGNCVPDDLQPCDDGNPCTMDDICIGRECRGKRDPSPIDPRCEL
jgi:hypothetical protein